MPQIDRKARQVIAMLVAQVDCQLHLHGQVVVRIVPAHHRSCWLVWFVERADSVPRGGSWIRARSWWFGRSGRLGRCGKCSRCPCGGCWCCRSWGCGSRCGGRVSWTVLRLTWVRGKHIVGQWSLQVAELETNFHQMVSLLTRSEFWSKYASLWFIMRDQTRFKSWCSTHT